MIGRKLMELEKMVVDIRETASRLAQANRVVRCARCELREAEGAFLAAADRYCTSRGAGWEAVGHEDADIAMFDAHARYQEAKRRAHTIEIPMHSVFAEKAVSEAARG
jgi:hypothetical protein